MGGRVVAIEGGFGVTVTQDVTAVGPGQFEFFTAVPSEAGIVVTCSTPVGSCTPDSLPDNRWQFTAPSTGGSTVTLTVTATLNGRVKNTNVIYTIAGARLDSVRIFSSRASGDALPGEAVTVTAIAQSANGSVPPVQIEPRNLLGAGATVGSPQIAPNQPSGTARVSRLYTAPKNLPQRSAEQFAASFPATAVAPPLPTVTNTRSLNVAALTLNAPLSI